MKKLPRIRYSRGRYYYGQSLKKLSKVDYPIYLGRRQYQRWTAYFDRVWQRIQFRQNFKIVHSGRHRCVQDAQRHPAKRPSTLLW